MRGRWGTFYGQTFEPPSQIRRIPHSAESVPGEPRRSTTRQSTLELAFEVDFGVIG